MCVSSRSEVIVGFVAEKLSQLLGNLNFNLFGTELSFFTGKRNCAVLCWSARVWDSDSVHWAEVRHLLNCSQKLYQVLGHFFSTELPFSWNRERFCCAVQVYWSFAILLSLFKNEFQIGIVTSKMVIKNHFSVFIWTFTNIPITYGQYSCTNLPLVLTPCKCARRVCALSTQTQCYSCTKAEITNFCPKAQAI